ncbi:MULTISPECIES: transcriptional regulator [Citrobacter]|jgi:predicted transcriptional regulator YheO|uniref:Transcriptional regulator n=1 Tax=Citrobacter amalonaticus TaxID=35703 RepID=A0A8I0MP56_CITAM|nr:MULTISPECIES: PAS domain-containing protein [Citrobacter]HAT6803791.1 transcriptional regulator [Citrobacter freundii]AMG94924.1 transcriptional regulator [Citrobacter amalonaticus]AUO64175.1 DNA-binding protein [Citrobacter freundii complex sp. CFNIH2]EKW2924931.1 PAS domain-containing protein [Citrobacter amalonaticus]EKW2929492.1 PAS domain-containing protein [Citrobacter amalonaticus]
MPKNDENSLLSQLDTIAKGLSETFSPFCEVVVHDLKDPEHAIMSIHNNLSGREAGQPATELGLARIASPDFPEIIANYGNQFADGRPVKSTSIGIKDEEGNYVAALCLNVDMTLFRGMQSALARFTETESSPVREHLDPGSTEVIRQRIDDFAAKRATTARALKTEDRKVLIQQLRKEGLLNVRKSMDTVAQHLGVSRATAYLYARQSG